MTRSEEETSQDNDSFFSFLASPHAVQFNFQVSQVESVAIRVNVAFGVNWLGSSPLSRTGAAAASSRGMSQEDVSRVNIYVLGVGNYREKLLLI
jgi:hypothetical protein